MTEQEYVDAVSRRCGEYERNVQAIVCLKSALCWDDDQGGYPDQCKFGSGRSMTPAEGDDVTPDAVVQFSLRLGLIAELKLTASSEDDFSRAEAQIRRYDQELEGWWTEQEALDYHQVACIVPHLHVGEAERWFDNCEDLQRFELLLSAAQVHNQDEFFMFERRRGEFRHQPLNLKFDPNTSIPMEEVWTRDEKKYCDDRPRCPEYTMWVLWSYYLPAAVGSLETRPPLRAETTIAQSKVNVEDARDYLRAVYSVCGCTDGEPREPSVPQKDWVRDALNHFVQIGRAEKDEDNSDVFWVAYNPAATATGLRDFARQVYRNCPPEWAQDESEDNLQRPLAFEQD